MAYHCSSKAGFDMQLAVITDEISDDLGHALDVASEYGVRGVELRQVWGKHVLDLNDEERSKAREIIAQHNMVVVGIATPFYKCDLPGETVDGPVGNLHSATAVGLADQIDLLQRAFTTAQFFQTNLIRIFTFWKRKSLSPELEDQIVDLMAEPVALAEEAGMILGLENEHACYIGTGAQTARILERVDSPALRVIWDPGNAYCDGERPFPNGYDDLKDFIAHVHVKDAAVDKNTGKPEWTVVGEGGIDWKGQFEALKNSGYAGYLSLETHYSGPGGKEASSRACFEGINRIIKEVGA
jgi:sugar phosphate isomerase/epimerase